MAESSETIHNVVIAGSGPAGLTAGIYASRAGLAPLLLEGPIETSGGQLTITTDVENFPGFPKGIMGPELVTEMKAQAGRFGTMFLADGIKSADLSSRPFTLELIGGSTVRARTLILATGATARLIGLPAEKEFMSKYGGVSACATCDGPLFRGKEIAVVGGGDSAMEEANFLTKFASKVTIIHRRDELRASKIMADRARNNPKIEFLWDTAVEDVLDLAQKKVTGLKTRNLKTNETGEFKCEGLFVAIGHDPNTAFLNGQVETDDHGFIRVKSPRTWTSVPGVFACGDVMDPTYKQAITAAGTGCSAAIDAERFLEEHGG